MKNIKVLVPQSMVSSNTESCTTTKSNYVKQYEVDISGGINNKNTVQPHTARKKDKDIDKDI